MFSRRFEIPLWAVVATALAFAGFGAFAATTVARDTDRIPDLQIALPSGTDSAGIYLEDVNAATPDELGLRNPAGVAVRQVQCGALQSGDLITALNGEPIAAQRDLLARINGMAPGSPLNLTLRRGGSLAMITVARPTPNLTPGVAALIQAPNPIQPTAPQPAVVTATNPVQPSAATVNTGLLVGVIRGVQVNTLTPNTMQQLGLSPNTMGVLVTAVDGGTPAAAAGLRPNDVVIEVNSSPVFNVLDFQKAVAAVGPNSATLRVNRRSAVVNVMIPAQ